jgi:hypothetical protein
MALKTLTGPVSEVLVKVYVQNIVRYRLMITRDTSTTLSSPSIVRRESLVVEIMSTGADRPLYRLLSEMYY